VSPLRTAMVVTLLFGQTVCGAMAAEGAFTPRDALRVQRIVDGPRVHPEGAAVAFVASDSTQDTRIRAHKAVGRLAIVDLQDRSRRTLSDHASDPVWSPDGAAIAFFESIGPDRQLVVVGYPDLQEKLRVGAAGPPSRYSARHFPPAWLAEGRKLLLATATEADDAADNMPRPFSLEGSTARLPFDRYFRDTAASRLAIVEVPGGELETVAPDLALRRIDVSPQGSRALVITSDPSAPGVFVGDTYRQPRRYHVLSTDTGRMREVELGGSLAGQGWVDEARLMYISGEQLRLFDAESGANRVVLEKAWIAGSSVSIGPKGVALWSSAPTADGDYLIAPPQPETLRILDPESPVPKAIVSRRDNRRILSVDRTADGSLLIHDRSLDDLRERVTRLRPGGSSLETVIEGAYALGSPSGADGGRVVAVAAETATRPQELYRVAPGNPVRLTDLNAETFAFVEPRLLEFRTGNGKVARALLYEPRDTSARTAPLIVTAYGVLSDRRHSFQYEAQLHALSGYAYLMPDIYVRRGRLDRAYTEDIPRAVAAVSGGGTRKTGFTGGSLGGYAGLVLLSATDLFDAAVLRAPPVSFAASWATGKDRDADLLEWLLKGETPYSDRDLYLANSPFWTADRIEAPLLLMHGTEDAQVPARQSVMMFQALRRLGKSVELRLYPGADHSVIRGSKDNFLDYYDRMFGWWQRHIRGPNPETTGGKP